MAFSFSATASTAPPLSCRAMIRSGLNLHSAVPFGTSKPNSCVDFFGKANLSVQRGTCNQKPTRGQGQIMSLGTPMVLYPGGKSGEWIDLNNALYRERIILIGEHIDEDVCNHLIATMLYLDIDNQNRRIYMYINVAGGDLTPSLAVYDTMQSLRTPIGTLCLGFAANLMGFILAAGDKGHRHAMPHARIQLESPANYAQGQADDVTNESKELLRISDYLCEELAKKTGQPLEKITKDVKYHNLRYLNPQQAIDYGVIDKIYKPPVRKYGKPRRRRARDIIKRFKLKVERKPSLERLELKVERKES